ncbi:MAG: DUF1956 domain-containing protein [Planctomycetes bacterium]|jgi:AcrR family transcriptional regulator|nr:DUF1956 domain-containing protein [Planctomycetota bacterium]
MTVRSDGARTRERLLAAALAVFAKKGYFDTKVADVCRRARANRAAVSYHFGGKQHLYAEVWRHAFAEADRLVPIDGGLPGDAPAEARLRALVFAILSRILRHGTRSQSGRLLLMEMARPLPALDAVRREATRPVRRTIRAITRELLGPDADGDRVNRTAMCIMHQMLAIGFRGGRKPPLLGEGPFSDAEVDALVDHVVLFSLGGIASVARAAASRPAIRRKGAAG